MISQSRAAMNSQYSAYTLTLQFSAAEEPAWM